MKNNHRKHSINSNFPQIIKYIIFILSVSYLVTYLWMAYYRLQYPFELEWIEGGMVDEVQRILNGQSIYVVPSIDFVPFLYPPLYLYISAGASALLGGGLFPLRLVSFIASLVSLTLIFLILRKETNDWWVGFVSAGLFCASFRVTGAWLDIARVDSLFLTFILIVIYLVRGKKSILHALLAGIFAALAYLTKQTALIVCVPILVMLFWQNWKYGLIFLVCATVIIGVTTLILEKESGGWYTYYTFGLLSQQTQWLPFQMIMFWKNDLLDHLPIVILFTVAFFVMKLKLDRQPILQWLVILTGALAATFITRVKIGGYDNVLLPTFAVLSILFGLGLSRILNLVNQMEEANKRRLNVIVLIACMIQFVILAYNPFAQIPTKADLNEGRYLVSVFSNVEGEVYLPDHGYIATLAGKRSYAHHAAIWDVVRTNQMTLGKDLLMYDLAEAIRQQRFDMIILDTDSNTCCIEIDQYYTRMGEVFQDQLTFFPVTGDKRRPTFIYLADRLK